MVIIIITVVDVCLCIVFVHSAMHLASVAAEVSRSLLIVDDGQEAAADTSNG